MCLFLVSLRRFRFRFRHGPFRSQPLKFFGEAAVLTRRLPLNQRSIIAILAALRVRALTSYPIATLTTETDDMTGNATAIANKIILPATRTPEPWLAGINFNQGWELKKRHVDECNTTVEPKTKQRANS